VIDLKTKIYDLNGNMRGEIELPRAFNTPYRPDIIKRAVLSLQSLRRQPYGTDPLAGKRTSAHYHGLRHYRWRMMGVEMSRMARLHGKIGHLMWRARFVPQAVKGRKAQPPKAEKKWEQKINKKEMLLAFKSALSACCNLEFVTKSGHHFQGDLPVIVEDSFEKIKKTDDALKVLKILGFEKELERGKEKKIRAGKGKERNRKYKKKKSLLVVVSQDCNVLKALKNLAGVDVCFVNDLNVELLAPGCNAGRLALFTKSALEMLGKMK